MQYYIVALNFTLSIDITPIHHSLLTSHFVFRFFFFFPNIIIVRGRYLRFGWNDDCTYDSFMRLLRCRSS